VALGKRLTMLLLLLLLCSCQPGLPPVSLAQPALLPSWDCRPDVLANVVRSLHRRPRYNFILGAQEVPRA
jgi:hypothetical protein